MKLVKTLGQPKVWARQYRRIRFILGTFRLASPACKYECQWQRDKYPNTFGVKTAGGGIYAFRPSRKAAQLAALTEAGYVLKDIVREYI